MSVSEKADSRKPDKTPGPTPPSHPGTTNVPDPAVANPRQYEQGKKARQDAEGEQVDTDLYNTSGNEAEPPKTPERKAG